MQQEYTELQRGAASQTVVNTESLQRLLCEERNANELHVRLASEQQQAARELHKIQATYSHAQLTTG